MVNDKPKAGKIAVIGAGIAGASVGYFLREHCRVTILEQESQPGYHTTGRSAALYMKSYGPPQIRAVTAGAEAFFRTPPADFTDTPLLRPRGTLHIASASQLTKLQQAAEEMAAHIDTVQRLDYNAAKKHVPVLQPHAVAGAIYEPDTDDIDVHALHQGFLRGVRAAGGSVMTDAEVVHFERRGGGWRILMKDGRHLDADIVVNAAGAWADHVGKLAGCREIGLVPKRRTVIVFPPPEGAEIETWPLVVDVEETFYFKPDAGRILGSPADETPMVPQDIQPDEEDVARAADRIIGATTLTIPRITQKWAGLRSFVADKTPVVGFDPDVPGFFWLAGQGGYGIQSAPGLGRLAASLVRGQGIPEDLAAKGADAAALSPRRLREQEAKAETDGAATPAQPGLPESAIHWDFAKGMAYGDYLKLDQILNAQQPLSSSHDELLFITVHQSAELWLKLTLHEIKAAQQKIREDALRPAFKMLARVGRIQTQLSQTWDVLSTLTPADYESFRRALGRSSGLQSFQYRELEFLLGLKDASYVAIFRHQPQLNTHLLNCLAAPSLYDDVQQLLARRGFAIDADHLSRDKGTYYAPNMSVEEAWCAVYRDTERYWELYELAEKLIDLEDAFQTWRFRHATTVERIIGDKAGTGGSSGTRYLKQRLQYRLFPELWQVRTRM